MIIDSSKIVEDYRFPARIRGCRSLWKVFLRKAQAMTVILVGLASIMVGFLESAKIKIRVNAWRKKMNHTHLFTIKTRFDTQNTGLHIQVCG